MVSFWNPGWGKEPSAAVLEWWGVCSATRVAVGPLVVSPSPLSMAVMGGMEAGVAGTIDAERSVPPAASLGCRRDKKAAAWGGSKKVMKGESLGLQAPGSMSWREAIANQQL